MRIESTDYFSSLQHDQNLISDSQRTKDASAKSILKYRAVLARILKYAVPDFRMQDPDDIAANIAADPDNEACAQIVNVESDHSGLSSIEFDIRTDLYTSSRCSVIINVEAQNTLRPNIKNGGTYSLAERGMYYISRLLSEQLGPGDNSYNTLRKCYSIWIIFDPKGNQPQVLDYKMTEQNNHQTALAQRYNHEIDLAELVFITMDRTGKNQQEIFGFLDALFKNPSRLTTFIPKTSDTEFIHKEAEAMCDIGELRYGEGYTEGIEKGIEKGIRSLIIALKATGASEETIIEQLYRQYDLSEEQAEQYLAGC